MTTSVLKSQPTKGVGQSVTTIFTADATVTATIIGLNVSNTGPTNLFATVQLKRGGVAYSILTKGLVPPGNSLSVIGVEGKIVAMPNDIIQAFNDTGSMDTILSYLEQTP